MIGKDYFWCPVCKAYTPDTYAPEDIEDLCPVCGSERSADAPEMGFDVNPSDRARGYRRVYSVREKGKVMDFVDDRSPAYFVKVVHVNKPKDGPKYLVMDDDGMCFALGDAPDPCDMDVVEKYCDEPFLRFNDNGPTRIRYTRNPGLVGSLNRKRAPRRAYCQCCDRKVKVTDIEGHPCCSRCGSIIDAMLGVRR